LIIESFLINNEESIHHPQCLSNEMLYSRWDKHAPTQMTNINSPEDQTWGKVINVQSAEKSGKKPTVKPARERKKRKNVESEWVYDFLQISRSRK
jgi:hypothetical protein